MNLIKKSLLPVSVLRQMNDIQPYEAYWSSFERIYDEAWQGNEIIAAACSSTMTLLMDDKGSVYKSSTEEEAGFTRVLNREAPRPNGSWFFQHYCRVCGSIDNLSHERESPHLIFCNSHCQGKYHAFLR